MTYDRRRTTLLLAALLMALLSIALAGLLALDLAPWPAREGTESIERACSMGAAPCRTHGTRT